MPQVPIQTTPTVSPSGGGMPFVQGGRTATVNQPAGSDRVAKNISTTLTSAGQAMLHIQDQIDETTAREYDTKFSNAVTTSMWGDKGFLRNKGVDAAKSYNKALKEMEDARTAMGETLKGNAREMFMRTSAARLAATRETMMRHTSVEYDNYRGQVLGGSIDASRQQAVLNFSSPEVVAQNMRRGAEDVRALAALRGLDPETEVHKFESGVYAGTIRHMAVNNDFTAAKELLEAHRKEGMTLEDVDASDRLITDGYNREQGEALAGAVQRQVGKAVTDRSAIIKTVVYDLEGGKYIKNDGGRGPSRWGITQKTFPNEDIENLTPERAAELYGQLWTENKIDSLPPQLRAIAFSTAINMGPKAMRQILEKSGGDPAKFMELRLEEYKKIDKAKGTSNLQGWTNRMAKEGGAFFTKVSLEAQIARIKAGAANDEQKENAIAKVKKDAAEIEAVKNADAQRTFRLAMEAHDRGETIPVDVWASLDYSEKKYFRNPIENTPQEVLDEVEASPELWTADGLIPYRYKMSVADYQNFLVRGANKGSAGGAEAQSLNGILLDSLLDERGFTKLVTAKKDSKKGKELRQLKGRILRDINAYESATGTKLNNEQKRKMMDNQLKDVRVRRARGAWDPVGWFGEKTYIEEVPAFKVDDPLNTVMIPVAFKNKIKKEFEARGIPYTPANIYGAWMATRQD